MATKIEQKITYDAKTYYYAKMSPRLDPGVKVGDEVKKGDIVAPVKASSNLVEIKYKGKPKVSAGDDINEGEIVSSRGKLKKGKTRTSVSGRIISIDDEKIIIAKKSRSIIGQNESVIIPFDATVKSVTSKGILFEFPAVTVNLLGSKGNSVTGVLQYISSEKFKTKPRPSVNPKTILVTDIVTKESYAIMSTMGALGIIANSIDYLTYNDIIILSVPLGIISGFGILKQNSDFTAYFKDKSGAPVWFDTQFDRLVIPEKNEPAWVNKYQFDLTERETK